MREINRTGNDSKPDSPIGQIIEAAQDKAYEYDTVDYDESTIGERELKFAIVSNTLYAYTKKDGQVYKSQAWTAI